MTEERHTAFSDGLRLDAKLWLPDEGRNAPLPLVVPCSGFTGLMDFHPARFARLLTRRGLACFGFDYRGFGESEGPRGRVILEEQVRDVQHAVAYAATLPQVDPERIFLLGWGMGAGLVLAAGRHLPGVRGLVCVNGFYSGRRLYESHRTPAEMAALRAEIRDERRVRATTGRAAWVDPFTFYLLDDASRGYVDEVLRAQPGYDEGRFSFELADSLLNWEPDVFAPAYRIPLLVSHGTENRLHPEEEAWRLFVAYGGARELYWLDGVGHTEWMVDGDPTLEALGAKIAGWIDARLAEPAVTSEVTARVTYPAPVSGTRRAERPGG